MGTMSKLALYIYGTKERPYHMGRKRHYENIGGDFDLESLGSPEMDNFLPESWWFHAIWASNYFNHNFQWNFQTSTKI